MLSSAAAVGFLQANFKRTFEDAEKEVEVAINQLIRASGGSIGTTEKCDAQKKVSNALSEIKKQVTKFNSSALFFHWVEHRSDESTVAQTPNGIWRRFVPTEVQRERKNRVSRKG